MSTSIDPAEVEFSPLSAGVDSFGRVFHWNHRLFRGIYPDSVPICRQMFSSGMIDELADRSFIPPAFPTEYEMEGFGLVLEHEKISPLNFPEEWSFSMFKDAAIRVLHLNQIAREYGFQTKDCHGYNLIFDGCRPKYVDLGSFTSVLKHFPSLLALDEFIRYYLHILEIWSEGNDYIARRILSGPMPQYSYDLYLRGKSNQKPARLTTRMGETARAAFRVLPQPLQSACKPLIQKWVWRKDPAEQDGPSASIDALRKQVEQFSGTKAESEWGKYHDEFCRDGKDIKSTGRFDRILEIVKNHQMKTVTDLGGGQGVLSRLLVQRANVEKAIIIDFDGQAVDAMYNRVKTLEGENRKIVPVLLDFISDTSLLGYEKCFPYSEGRFKSEAVMALAVTHHLLLRQKRSLDFILNVMARYTKKYAFIEFMPLGLWSEGGTVPPVPSWYTIQWFRNHFGKYFRLLLEEELEKNRILFFGKLPKS